MVKDFEKHTKTRVPKRGAPNAEYADFVARATRRTEDAAEGSAEDRTRALVAISPPPSANANKNANEAKKMRLSTSDPSDPPDAGALLAAWSSYPCLLYTSPSPRDLSTSRMPSSA